MPSTSGQVNHHPSGEWSTPKGRNRQFDFHLDHPQLRLPDNMSDASPHDFFNLYMSDEIIDMMVSETNRYAEQVIIAGIAEETIGPSSRLHKWTPTDRGEMLKFLGLIGYMGLVKYPSYQHYWSSNYLYKNDVCSTAMSRNRFEILMKMWHFSNNEECPENDRLHKLRPLLQKLQEKFSSLYIPGETVCVDESMIPFRGRLIFKQYLPNKAHKYGVKEFKLCSDKGYTWNFIIYEGKEREKGRSVPSNIVMKLSENLLDQGRTVVTDNYYTSIDLANLLLARNTHLLGTLRKNRKNLPREVVDAKLKKGEVMAKENSDGIVVLKWKDKRDVLVLSTKHGDNLVQVKTKNRIVTKPEVIIAYNDGKAHIDLSDQMSFYNSSLRKSFRWYKKVAIDLVFGTTLVNSHILYKLATKKNISVTQFKEQLVEYLLNRNQATVVEITPPRRQCRHSLQRKQGDNRKVRRGCTSCKKKKIGGTISKNQIKKVVTYCALCPGEPFYCLPCFNEFHP